MKPDSYEFLVAFNGSNYVDVSQWVDWGASYTTRFGRSSPFSAPSPATLGLTLLNDDARFTAGRQVLADGVTAHPYYPNVKPRRPCRLSWRVGASTYYRFTGYTGGWPTQLADGDHPQVSLTATTIDNRLTRVKLKSTLQESLEDVLHRAYWPLTEATGSTSAFNDSDGAGNFDDGRNPLLVTATVAPLAFGADGVGSGNGTAVAFAPAGAGTGQILTNNDTITFTQEAGILLWINVGSVLPAWATSPGTRDANILGFDTDYGQARLYLANTTGVLTFALEATSGVTYVMPSSVSVLDGMWHQVFLDFSAATGDRILVDGTPDLPPISFPSPIWNLPWSIDQTVVGDRYPYGTSVSGRFTGSVGHLALTDSLGFSVAAGYLDLDLARRGRVGETIDTRIGRWLTKAGVLGGYPSRLLEASTVPLGSFDQAGQDVVSSMQAMATSEGGGSVVWVGPEGAVRFRARASSRPTVPTLTVDAEADLDGPGYTPAYDDDTVANSVTGTRATASGTASASTLTDATSIATYDLIPDDFTSYAQSAADVVANTADRLAQQKSPAYRMAQVPVDLVTAQTTGLMAQVAATGIGDRLRVTNLPPGAAPTNQVDGYVQAWTEVGGADQLTVTFETTPADNPAGGVYDDTTYGRYQCVGQTLSAALTAAGTTVSIATTGGNPTMTVLSGSYPLTIDVNEEQITLPAPPSGSTSPQTWTGVTRGVNGTTAAAQASGSTVSIANAGTYRLG